MIPLIPVLLTGGVVALTAYYGSKAGRASPSPAPGPGPAPGPLPGPAPGPAPAPAPEPGPEPLPHEEPEALAAGYPRTGQWGGAAAGPIAATVLYDSAGYNTPPGPTDTPAVIIPSGTTGYVVASSGPYCLFKVTSPFVLVTMNKAVAPTPTGTGLTGAWSDSVWIFCGNLSPYMQQPYGGGLQPGNPRIVNGGGYSPFGYYAGETILYHPTQGFRHPFTRPFRPGGHGFGAPRGRGFAPHPMAHPAAAPRAPLGHPFAAPQGSASAHASPFGAPAGAPMHQPFGSASAHASPFGVPAGAPSPAGSAFARGAPTGTFRPTGRLI